MSNYNDQFKLNTLDIELIENSLREQISKLADRGMALSNMPEQVKQLNNLLGKIHNQKHFYSIVKGSNVPLG